MKMEIDYPFLTRGKPRRCGAVKDIYVTMRTTVDVPVVSISDMDTVLDTPKHFFRHDRPFVGQRCQVGDQLKSFDGRLFRKVDAPPGFTWNRRPFSNESHPVERSEHGSLINLAVYREGLNPITSAIRNQFEWILESESGIDSGEVNAWPNERGKWLRTMKRSETIFGDMVADITEIDEEIHGRGLEMLAAETGRLVMADGELWITCGPPCWVVDLNRNAAKDEVTIYLGVLPTGIDAKMERRYFSLDRLDEAREYASWCVGTGQRDRRRFSYAAATGDFDMAAPSDLLAFDQDAYELERLSLLFAMESARRVRSKPELWDLLDGRQRVAVGDGYLALAATNHLLGKRADIVHLAHDLTDAWQALKMPAAYITTGASKAEYGRAAADRIRSLADGTDIAVDIGHVAIASAGIRR
nr:hypothetical protein [Neorhizobium tomejilense]